MTSYTAKLTPPQADALENIVRDGYQLRDVT